MNINARPYAHPGDPMFGIWLVLTLVLTLTLGLPILASLDRRR